MKKHLDKESDIKQETISETWLDVMLKNYPIDKLNTVPEISEQVGAKLVKYNLYNDSDIKPIKNELNAVVDSKVITKPANEVNAVNAESAVSKTETLPTAKNS